MKTALVVTALILSIAVASSARQSQGPLSSLDLELWTVTLEAVSRENGRSVALLNETLPAAEIEPRLRGRQDTEPVFRTLIERALGRNEMPVRISSTVNPGVELLEIGSVRKPGSGFDWETIRSHRQLVVRLSLPVVTDDGTRALVFSWTACGFDCLSGAGYVFEKKPEGGTIIQYIAAWIT